MDEFNADQLLTKRVMLWLMRKEEAWPVPPDMVNAHSSFFRLKLGKVSSISPTNDEDTADMPESANFRILGISKYLKNGPLGPQNWKNLKSIKKYKLPIERYMRRLRSVVASRESPTARIYGSSQGLCLGRNLPLNLSGRRSAVASTAVRQEERPSSQRRNRSYTTSRVTPARGGQQQSKESRRTKALLDELSGIRRAALQSKAEGEGLHPEIERLITDFEVRRSSV